jgi:lysine-specific permease
MVTASFAFAGTELVGITAGEAKNPRKTIPKAINGTFWRILFFYISCFILIGFLIPANSTEFTSEDNLTMSPFVIALKQAGIFGVDHFMNAVCFIAVFSAANSTIYGSGRCLMALAQEGQAPAFLGRTRNGVPYYSMLVSVAFGCIAFAGKFIGSDKVLYYLVDMTGLGLILTWLMINVTHLRFRAAYLAQGFSLKDLPYQALYYPFGCWFGIITMSFTIVMVPLLAILEPEKDDDFVVAFVSSCISIPLFLILFFGWKMSNGTKFVPLMEVDLFTSNINLVSRFLVNACRIRVWV